MKKLKILSVGVLLAPMVALAAAFAELRGNIDIIIGWLAPLLVAIAVIYFIWGVIQFVIAGDEKKRAEGQQRMIHGVIGFAVILSLWGLVRLTQEFVGGGIANENNQTGGDIQNLLPNLNNNGNSPQVTI